MAYFDVYTLTTDADFNGRVSACYAAETLSDPAALDPWTWTSQHNWDMASAPGFGDAYASAIASGVQRPGQDPSVISDGQILAAVQYLLAQAAPAPK